MKYYYQPPGHGDLHHRSSGDQTSLPQYQHYNFKHFREIQRVKKVGRKTRLNHVSIPMQGPTPCIFSSLCVFKLCASDCYRQIDFTRSFALHGSLLPDNRFLPFPPYTLL